MRLRVVRGRWDDWGAPYGSSCDTRFIGVLPGGRRIVTLGSLWCAMVVLGFTAVAEFIDVRPEDGHGHLGSLRLWGGRPFRPGSLVFDIEVVGFIRSR